MSRLVKTMGVLILTLGLFFGLIGCQTTPDQGDNVEITIALYDEVKLIEETFEVKENTSVYDVLEAYFDATYTMYGEDYFLETLTYQSYVLEPVGQQYISFYVNDQSSMVGISDYFVKAEDVIAFKLESWS